MLENALGASAFSDHACLFAKGPARQRDAEIPHAETMSSSWTNYIPMECCIWQQSRLEVSNASTTALTATSKKTGHVFYSFRL